MSRNPLWNENTFVGKIVAVCTIAVLVVIGLIVAAVVNSNRKGAQIGFMDEKLAVIVVYEDDEKANDKLMKACKGKYDESKPVFTFDEEEGERKFCRPEVIKGTDLPQPRFIQIVPPVTKEGKPSASPIYGVFKDPKATEKLRRWAKNNNYPEWDFKLKWRDEAKYETEKVAFSKPGSSVSIIAFYEKSGRIYMWDGEVVRDCSAGLTSNAGGKKGEAYYREYMKWLVSAGL